MSDAFDPFHRWLGIPLKDQPPHHYRLLGIDLFESDPGVIESAADRQMSHVRSFQSGPHSRQSQEMLNLLSSAKICLLNPQKKAVYDQGLHARRSEASQSPAQPSLFASPATIASVQPAGPIGANHASYNFAPQTIPAPAYQPTVYQSAGNNPPPVPTANPPRPVRMPNIGLVAAVAGMALFLCGIMGSVVWWRLNELQEQPLVAKRAAEAANEQPAPQTAKPITVPQQPGKPPAPTVINVPTSVQVRVQPVPVAPAPASIKVPPAKPAPLVMRPAPSPFVEAPNKNPLVPAPEPPPLDPQELAQRLQGIRSGLTHWWGLHEIDGVRRDIIGSKDLKEQNRVGSAPGVLGNCARFTGKQYLRVESDPSLQLQGNRTIAVWARFSNTRRDLASVVLLGKWSVNGSHDFMVCYNAFRETPNRFEFLVWESGASLYKVLYSSFSDATVDKWYFVTCQRNAERGMIAISINGGPFDTMSVGQLQTCNDPLYVGADHGPPWTHFHGDLALLGIWNRLLSPAEVTALYNNGRGVDIDTLPMPN